MLLPCLHVLPVNVFISQSFLQYACMVKDVRKDLISHQNMILKKKKKAAMQIQRLEVGKLKQNKSVLQSIAIKMSLN